MRNIIKSLLFGLILFIPLESFAVIVTFDKSNCDLLKAPRTVLLVHASWCSHCKALMPTYQRISDLEKYKNWTFYEVVNDKFEPICNREIDAVPAIFKNNMANHITGIAPQWFLEEYFLDR